MLTKNNIFIICSIAFIIGIFLGSVLPFDPTIFIIMIFIFLLIAILFWTDKVVKICALILLCLILGIGRYGLSEPKVNSQTVQFYNGQKVSLVGVVTDEPDVRKDKTNLVINVSRLETNNHWQDVSGKILLQTQLYPEYKYGDELKIEGKLETPPEFPDFSYRDYLSRYQIFSTMRNSQIEKLAQGKGNIVRQILLTIKSKFTEKIDQTLSEPQASLLAGILYGARRGIPDDIMDALNKTGLTHIVVISGYNITIIASLLLALFSIFPRRIAFALTLAGILIFTVFVGAGSSVVRAAIMGSIALLAFHVQRKTNVFSALLLAAIIMLIINPKILRFDIGFQLSFMSTLGLIFLSPLIEKFFKWLPKLLSEPAALTLSAQVFTIPIILYNFHRLSLIAPLVNVLVLPTIPFVMIVGFIGTIAGFVVTFLGQIINWVSWALLTYIIKVAEFLAKLPLASLEFKPQIFILILYYFLLAIFLVWQSRIIIKSKVKSEKSK